jgi:hypothetical protein
MSLTPENIVVPYDEFTAIFDNKKRFVSLVPSIHVVPGQVLSILSPTHTSCLRKVTFIEVKFGERLCSIAPLSKAEKAELKGETND